MAFRAVVAVTSNCGKSGLRNKRNPCQSFRPLLSCAPVALVSFDRAAHSQDITKNIQYISNEKIKLTADPETMKLNKDMNKPLCVMINWLLARQKHVMKYAAIYLEQGYDVLSVSCTPWQVMWPMKGTQLVARDLLKFITANENQNPLIIHGFSVGGYLWGELCVHAMKDKERYQLVLDRVMAQIWDSAADITEIPIGFPRAVFPNNRVMRKFLTTYTEYMRPINRVAAQIWDSAADVSEVTIGVPAAVFPKNKVMQKTLSSYMEYHMKTFYDASTCHYIRSSQMFHTNLCRAPALLLLSKSDPVGAERSNRAVHDSWVKMGIKCTWKCWDKSPHVQHFMHHRKEYLSALYDHLDANGLLSQPEKLRLRI